jgi:hypothetical protein
MQNSDSDLYDNMVFECLVSKWVCHPTSIVQYDLRCLHSARVKTEFLC